MTQVTKADEPSKAAVQLQSYLMLLVATLLRYYVTTFYVLWKKDITASVSHLGNQHDDDRDNEQDEKR